MARYFIEEAKCGMTGGGMACGPFPGTVVAAVRFRKSKKSKLLYLSEADGIPCFTLTDKDVFDDLLKEDTDDGEFIDYLNDHNIDELDGIEFGCGYDELFESISDDSENPVIPLIRYIVALVRCETEDTEPLIAMAQGKYADELEIPVSDVEEEVMEEAADKE